MKSTSVPNLIWCQGTASFVSPAPPIPHTFMTQYLGIRTGLLLKQELTCNRTLTLTIPILGMIKIDYNRWAHVLSNFSLKWFRWSNTSLFMGHWRWSSFYGHFPSPSMY